MFKLSKVVKLTGASRKALQDWNKKGIVKPSVITEGGYWLYDADALLKVNLVLIYREIGYSLDEIKTIMDSREAVQMKNWTEEMEHLKHKLEDERNKINGMIKFVDDFTFLQNLPESVIKVVLDYDFEQLAPAQNSNFLTGVHEYESKFDYLKDFEGSNYMLMLIYELSFTGLLKKNGSDLATINEYIDDMYATMKKMLAECNIEEEESELLQLFSETMRDFLSEEDFTTVIDTIGGDGSSRFIKEHLSKWFEDKGVALFEGVNNESDS